MMKILLLATLVCCGLSAGSADYMEQQMKTLTRQVMLQQFFTEQRVRSEGQSGVKLIRQRRSGAKNYFHESHTGYFAAAVHDHANNIRTVGMGEFTGVLNGIEFKTRHNDYRLFMPHRTSQDYHKTEPIPFPGVPPAVQEKKTVEEQVVEMREWFKAWKNQDFSKRNYRKYFKPVLCYLEGAWTKVKKNIDEPFSSDRHFIDADNWMELHEKSRYVAYSGVKSLNENLSFLPTKIIGMNDTIPEFAQWNYRILCHPVKRDVPLSELKVVEDLSSRMMTNYDIIRHKVSRAARFQLKPSKQKNDRPVTRGQIIDEIMAEIPGKNNYNSYLEDEGLEGAALYTNGTKMDVSKYHRWFRIEGRDAMGTSQQHRGYSDDALFMSMTTHPEVASVKLKKCDKKTSCRVLTQRWTYAIPLELIYLTPLYNWNPYKVQYHGEDWKKWVKATVYANGRNGDCENSGNKALNGTSSKTYYRTPSIFYSGESVNNQDAADTARGVTCVLDKNGEMQRVRAAGTHVFLPDIKDVGVLRQRYPIFPVHGEGSSVWKELNALREIAMNHEKYKYMFWDASDDDLNAVKSVELEMGYSSTTKTSKHTHKVELTVEQNEKLRRGERITVNTEQANGHSHELQISFWVGKYSFHKCDNRNSKCWDNHARQLTVIE